jgi:hypothetical protein
MVVVAGRSGKLTPPSNSVDGERTLRLIVDVSSPMMNVLCSDWEREGVLWWRELDCDVFVYVAFMVPTQRGGSASSIHLHCYL